MQYPSDRFGKQVSRNYPGSVGASGAYGGEGELHTYSLGTQLAAVGDLSFAATGKQVLRIDRKAYAAALDDRPGLLQ